jgi:transketolase
MKSNILTNDLFEAQVKKVRREVLNMIVKSSSGHIGASFSIAPILVHLYNTYNINDIGNYNSDILILSKGHAVPAMYACEKIYKNTVTDEDIDSFREIHSKLQGHPDKVRFPEMVASTGSLGQGLSIACGHAIQKKKKNLKGTVFCIIGDGEFQEGQIFEAMMFAAKEKLDNLVVILDNNGYQNDGAITYNLNYNNIADSFGMNVYTIKNSEHVEEYSYISQRMNNLPMFINMQTKKAAGVSFMENNPSWHTKTPTDKELKMALKELS